MPEPRLLPNLAWHMAVKTALHSLPAFLADLPLKCGWMQASRQAGRQETLFYCRSLRMLLFTQPARFEYSRGA